MGTSTNERKTTSVMGSVARVGIGVLAIAALGGALAGCGGSSGPPCDAQLQASWSITANGVPVSCAQAGASEVDFIVDGMEVPVRCTDLSGATPGFDAGTHSVTLELRDSSQNVLSRLGPMTESFACGDIVDLGEVEFSLTP